MPSLLSGATRRRLSDSRSRVRSYTTWPGGLGQEGGGSCRPRALRRGLPAPGRLRAFLTGATAPTSSRSARWSGASWSTSRARGSKRSATSSGSRSTATSSLEPPAIFVALDEALNRLTARSESARWWSCDFVASPVDETASSEGSTGADRAQVEPGARLAARTLALDSARSVRRVRRPTLQGLVRVRHGWMGYRCLVGDSRSLPEGHSYFLRVFDAAAHLRIEAGPSPRTSAASRSRGRNRSLSAWKRGVRPS